MTETEAILPATQVQWSPRNLTDLSNSGVISGATLRAGATTVTDCQSDYHTSSSI